MGFRNRLLIYKTPGASRKVTAPAGGFCGQTIRGHLFGMTLGRLSHPGFAYCRGHLFGIGLDNPAKQVIR